MKLWRIRLSPSGAPIDNIPDDDIFGLPFSRGAVAAYNTVVYEAPAAPAAFGVIAGPAGVNPALVSQVVPADYPFNRVRLYANLALQALFSRETGDQGFADLSMLLQVRVDAGAWGNPFWIGGDAASGNGSVRFQEQHAASEGDAQLLSESFALACDAVLPITRGVAHTVDVRAIWQRAGIYSVRSSYADETYANGGWHLEAYLAAEPSAP